MVVNTTEKQPPEEDIRVYRRRWLILGLFVFSCGSSTMQWVQYSIIANVIVDYYEISFTEVDWTSMVFLLTYCVFIFPGCYTLNAVVSLVVMYRVTK